MSLQIREYFKATDDGAAIHVHVDEAGNISMEIGFVSIGISGKVRFDS